MRLTRRDGQAAVLALVFVLMGIMVLGLVMDLGFLVVQRTRLDHAADAAARAVARACGPVAATDTAQTCPAETAARYLHANLPDAQVEEVQVDAAAGRVTVGASLMVPHPFSALWEAAPARLVAQASAKIT